jgi:acyl phosphate:glycerol-3-phosphate acyltransferase
MQTWWFWAIVAYFSGSVPFGLLMGLSKGVDIRRFGSGNVGATNTGRVLGKKFGITCFMLDALKGAGPVLAAGWWMGLLGRDDLSSGEAWRWLAVGAAAVIGHVFSIWLRFRGGKGVATGIGSVIVMWPLMTLPAVAALATWLLLASTFRYVSLASMCAGLSLPAYLLVAAQVRQQDPMSLMPFFVVTAGMGLLVVIRHHANLSRLAAGTEPRLGGR